MSQAPRPAPYDSYSILAFNALHICVELIAKMLSLSLSLRSSLPITLWETFYQKWPFGPDVKWLCQCAVAVQAVPVFMSSIAIGAIAADRYRAVVHSDR